MSAVIKSKSTISPHASIFNNFEVVSQSWYVLTHSRRLKKGQVKTFERLGRKLAVYRDELGKVNVLDAHCPHFGADLGRGKVIGRELECPFHHWRFDSEGKCSYAPNIAAPKRQAKSYPVLEKWGFIWFFSSRVPFMSFPKLPQDNNYHTFWLPNWYLNCHPHLVIGNSLDINHFETLHNFQFTKKPVTEHPSRHSLRIKLQGKPKDKRVQRLTGTKEQDVEATILVSGGNIAWLHLQKPVDFQVFFNALPTKNKKCKLKIFVFIPKGKLTTIPQVIALLFALFKGDGRILNRLKFSAGFTEHDETFREFVALVNKLPIG